MGAGEGGEREERGERGVGNERGFARGRHGGLCRSCHGEGVCAVGRMLRVHLPHGLLGGRLQRADDEVLAAREEDMVRLGRPAERVDHPLALRAHRPKFRLREKASVKIEHLQPVDRVDHREVMPTRSGASRCQGHGPRPRRVWVRVRAGVGG